MIEKVDLNDGLALLRQPVLPLVSIAQFIYLTGDFASVKEVIAEFPGDLETGYTCYPEPAQVLAPYADLLEEFSALKTGAAPGTPVIGVDNQPVDAMTATTALVAQRILTRELEQINSLLCAPCGCTLCCVGPTPDMVQRYFEIPLGAEETAFFPINRIDSADSRARKIDHEPPLQVEGRDFFMRPDPVLVHWQPGWSLVLPTGSRCPNLEDEGRCRIYIDRPQVCRRPQIFPYIIEPVEEGVQPPAFRLRQSLLAVVDCPYVQLLRDEIAAYAAACELEMLFRQNKA